MKMTNSVYSYIQYALCEGFPSSPFNLFCSSELPFHLSLYPLVLGATESRDGMTINQHSRGGAAMLAYEM